MLVLTVIYMVARRLLTFKEAMGCVPKGFIAMVPAILILTLATTLKTMTGLLGSDTFVADALANAGSLHNFLPAIIFIVACCIAFATGTSWGTFGILIPIVLSVFPVGQRAYGHRHVSLPCRCRLRRPLLTDIRYHHYVVGRCAVRACKPCLDTVAIRDNGRSRFVCRISADGFCPELAHHSAGIYSSHACSAVCNKICRQQKGKGGITDTKNQ